jgi:hypothetical protein
MLVNPCQCWSILVDVCHDRESCALLLKPHQMLVWGQMPTVSTAACWSPDVFDSAAPSHHFVDHMQQADQCSNGSNASHVLIFWCSGLCHFVYSYHFVRPILTADADAAIVFAAVLSLLLLLLSLLLLLWLSLLLLLFLVSFCSCQR